MENIEFLINSIKESENEYEEIIDKDIAMIIGMTGVGKSTTFNYLCGSKLSS